MKATTDTQEVAFQAQRLSQGLLPAQVASSSGYRIPKKSQGRKRSSSGQAKTPTTSDHGAGRRDPPPQGHPPKKESSYSRRGGRGGGGAGGSSSRGRGGGRGGASQKPVGGRLQAFGPEWERLTSDKWVLQTIKTGYRIEFTGPCRLTRSPMWTRIPAKESHRLAMETGLRKMLEKRAVKIVDPLLDGPGFYSSLFLVEKRSGGWRPILNLKELNVAVKPPSFKMDTLQSVLVSLGEDIRLSQSANTLGSGQDMWAVSLDLEDAYFHVAIDPRDRKYLRFAYDGTVYEFQVLPFGLSTAPRTFTRLVRAVGAYLKTCGVNLFQYLDDWLVVGGSYDLTLQYRYLVRTCVQEIGFLINEEKSDWVPTQFPSFLGSSLDLVRALARPSGDRIDRLRRLIGRVMKEGSSTARLWRSLFGHLASMMYLVPKARQHIRPLQFFVQNQWSQDMPDTTRIRLTQSARIQLEWWLDPTNLTLGVPFSTPDPALTIVTDASSYGWGGHLGDQTASGVWPDQWKSKHINWLELQAVWLTLKHFQDQVRNQVVEVLSDNSTTVSYINRQGGTHSLTLCRLALDMWEWCDQLAIVPVAVHLQGTRNILADALSRGRYCPTEWSLHPPTLRALFSIWGTHGRPVRNTEEQETTDVLLPIQGTRVERGQCPDSELGRSVRVCIPPHSTAPQSAQEDQTPPNSGGDPSGPILAEPNLVPPTNPDVSGLPQEVARQVEPPEELRDGGIVPRTQQAPIGCVENLRQSYRAQGFSEAVAKLASCGKRPSTYRVYDSRLAHYSRWCTTRSLDPNSAPVQQIAEFLSDLAKMTEPGHSLSYNTIVGYRTAIGAIHTGFSEGVTVSNHPVLQSVMKGIFNSKATTRQLKPVWDLGHLSQAPFEPMARASLRNLSVKTAFLIQLASGRRGGWIHACRMDPAYLRKESGFTFLSSLILDKNQYAHFTPEPVFIAALSDHSPDDKLHCPIRALKWYLDKTKTIRGQEKALFISSKEPHLLLGGLKKP